jgi:hypothetical protein
MGVGVRQTITNPRALAARIASFNQPGALKLDWHSVRPGANGFIPKGRGYDLSGLSEFDPGRTHEMVWAGKIDPQKRIRGSWGMDREVNIMQGVDVLAKHFGISQISCNQPFPSTAEFKKALEKGWLYSVDPEDSRYSYKPWMPGGYYMSPERMVEIYVKAHRRVNRLDRPGGFFDRQKASRRIRLAA